MTEATPLPERVLPVAEVCCGRLYWHIQTPTHTPDEKFLNNETHFLYDQEALDAVSDENQRLSDRIEHLEREVKALRGATSEESIRSAAVRITNEPHGFSFKRLAAAIDAARVE